MDFKVAGTRDFVTALQLDTKLNGIPAVELQKALLQAREARHTLLEVMGEAIDVPDEMSPYTPRIVTLRIPVDKIGEVISPKGKIIRRHPPGDRPDPHGPRARRRHPRVICWPP